MQLSEIKEYCNSAGLWQPGSWRHFSASQQPDWVDQVSLAAVTEQLGKLPGLVGAREIEALKGQVAEAGLGRRFILQAGDCAERFQDCREDVIADKMRIILQMALVIGFAGRRPVVPVGRMAGQYAKPRSEPYERLPNGAMIPIFRGESVNSFGTDLKSRQSDPLRLLQAYHCSSATLNFIRTLMGNGFGGMHNLDSWDLETMPKGAYWKRYDQIVSGLRDAMSFISDVATASGATNEQAASGQGFKHFFVSHEALLLPYEESLTRFIPEMGRYYNLSAHMLWIGDRTRSVDGAHVEYCRGVGNPVGIKVGSVTDAKDLIEVISRINPHNEAGKITLITRFGAGSVRKMLPSLIRAVNESGLSVTWSVDPMHGNTERLVDGRKTRRFEAVVDEIHGSFEAHRDCGSTLGGIHLELTSEAVTECTGGTAGITESMLGERYETWCDPRLNGSQSLEVAFMAAACLRREYNRHLI